MITGEQPDDPTTWEVIPKTWRVVDVPRVGQVLAVLMPYPGQSAEDRACAGDERFLNFNLLSHPVNAQRLSEVCAGCNVLTACREYAIAHEDYGVWGGTTPKQRRVIRRQRRQALVPPEIAYAYGLRPEEAFTWAGGDEDAEDQTDRASGCDGFAGCPCGQCA